MRPVEPHFHGTACGGSDVVASRPLKQLAGNWLDRAFSPEGKEFFSILGPRPLRDVHHYDSELRKQLQSTGRGLAKELIPSEQATEAGIHGRTQEVAIRQGLPSTLPSGFAGDPEAGQDGYEMHVHMSVKQPHVSSRRPRTPA